MSLQFGTALGLAIATVVNLAATDADPTAGALLDGYRAALVVPVTATILGAAITAICGLRVLPNRSREGVAV